MSKSCLALYCASLLIVCLVHDARTLFTNCGGQFTQEAGQILSPNFPNEYPNDASCSWVITVQPSKIIDFRFNSIDIEDSGNGRCMDYVVLHDGPSRQDPIISGDLCTPNSELQYRSRGNQMLVFFYSDYTFHRSGFSASYKTVDCAPFTYGRDVCDKGCTCVQDNTMYCNSVNSTCACKAGWTSSDCSLDINECLKPYMCSDLYSTCLNVPGSYNCPCRDGMVLNSTGHCEDKNQCKVKKCSHACGVDNSTETCYCPKGMRLDPKDNITCHVCEDWKFGENCAFDCLCIKSQTQSCDKVEGLCSCYLNWTSTDCSQDVNECELEKPPCDTSHSRCYNTYGWFQCQCSQGFETVANETTCEECGRTLTTANGSIVSPYFDYYHYVHQYRDGLIDCNWTIQVNNQSHVISLQLTKYNGPLQVEMYDGDSVHANLIGSYGGQNNYQTSQIFRSSANQMHIVRRSLYNYGSFQATYWSHECPEFMFDQSCTKPCKCVKNNTEYCESTNGSCVCKREWKSEDCSVDADECLDDPLACPDYSDCTNLNGSFHCTCKAGFLNTSSECIPDPAQGYCAQANCSQVCVNATGHGSTSDKCYCPIGMMLEKGQCVECKNMTYGQDCNRHCQCVPNNTLRCDAHDGVCECLSTWTGTDCSRDINECDIRSVTCPQPMSVCSNRPGSYKCVCQEINGYKESNNGTCTPIDCSHSITNASGTITSPNFPQNYFNYANCSWTITVASGNVVSLRFSTLSVYLYSGSKCNYDYIVIYDGVDTNARLIGHYCLSFPDVIRSTRNNMHIRFITDSYNVETGFNASYTSHPCPDFTYGNVSCDKDCSCNQEHTQFCDSTNGVCICKIGWVGIDCDTDLNECLDSISNLCPHNSECVNTAGGFLCQCHPGFALNSSTNVCDFSPNCEEKKCSHTCFVNSFGVEQCACPEELILDQAEGLYCVVPYYPYGAISNDDQISRDTNIQNITASAPVPFSAGVPFGTTLQVSATVHFNGLISFDDGEAAGMGTPDLKLALDIKLNVIASYWANTNPTKGQVFHKLYEKCEPSMFLESPMGKRSPNKTDVMKRVAEDVSSFYNLPGFEADTALVVTWEKLRPYTLDLQTSEENTFQAIFVSGWTKENIKGQSILSDEVSSYVIFLYQQGLMNWLHVPGRPIGIGTTGLNFQDISNTDTSTVEMLDRILGNTGYNGVWTYKVGSSSGPEQKCHKYVCSHANLVTDLKYQAELNQLYKCPCTLERLGRQWQLYEKRGPNRDIYCYAISALAKRRLLFGNFRNKLCCYRWNKPACGDWQAWERTWREASYLPKSPDSGHVLINDLWSVDPFNNFQARENIQAHQWCCKDSNNAASCNRFYKVFPDMGCSNYVVFVPASALGDPHITTLDGKTYTMNGWGEYTMMEIPSENFTLQARTGRAETANGTLTNATVFTAFAARESNISHFQVELAWTNTTMVIIANGADLTNDYYDDFDFSFSNEVISVVRECRGNRTSVVATFPCGVSVKVNVGVKSLEIELEVNKDLANKTRGLLGNFNNNTDDEFSLPDGTVLADNLSERDIYYKFAKEWAVTENNSVFIYDQTESAADYQHPKFVPMFIDEADPNLVKIAKSVCGENHDACIFDYILTGDERFANNTKQFKEQQEGLAQSLVNRPPVLAVNNATLTNGRWLVEQGKVSVLQVVISDEDKDAVSLHVVGGSISGVTVSDNGTVTYVSDVNIVITLSLQVKDSKGSYSSTVFIPISTCSGCSGNGYCDVTGATRKVAFDNDLYQIRACVCNPAYTGIDCESELDACIIQPCSVGQNCTDLTAQEQGKSLVGYTCGPCPQGFEDFGGKCTDVNECTTTNNCKQNCFNTEGSYFCGCQDGYRLNDTDKTTCIDINECEERIAKCQQLCQNTDGSYNCSCNKDYKINSDGVTCNLDISYIAACQHCEQVCTVNNSGASCSCNVGYQSDPNSKTNNSKCKDIDECKSGNMPCSQVCNNTQGSYTCGCYSGYTLDVDKISCSACKPPYYGDKCASICNCQGHGTCNPVRGCMCVDQWKGVSCDTDVDECEWPDVCPNGQVCRNEKGSFTCVCPPGYQMENRQCKDIDECSGPQAVLRCKSAEICLNNEGSYSCGCKQGFARNSRLECKDIDECSSGVDKCEQICENVPGQYNCQCFPGYKLAEDRSACRKDRDLCGQVLNCSHGCSVDLEKQVPFCYCPLGYKLATNTTCEDINECESDSLNLCSFKSGCINTNGSYTCSCEKGHKLDNDGRTCVACTGGTWGINCANPCRCGTGSDHCDPAIGCICKSGYTGKLCNDDINECQSGTVNCQLNEKCVNLPGTAVCECQNGYQNVSGQCQDINECINTTTNNCPQVCNNIEGSFTCSCNPGYIYDSASNKCSDINECDLPTSRCGQICLNTQGSYRCSCRQGLRLNTDGLNCEALTSCTTLHCSDQCVHILTKDVCLCPKGKTLSDNGTTCLDVDLCAHTNCNFGCIETHQNTSYECVCPTGTKLAADGVNCFDCLRGTWGPNCANSCSCLASNTQDCDKMTGSCTCKKGWKGTNCEIDINECTSMKNLCSEFSDCQNIRGGYVCACQPGYIKKNESSDACEECDNNYFGQSCLQRCSCSGNSDCSNINGSCHCSSKWTGDRCDIDVDECRTGSHTCDSLKHENCINRDGGYECGCEIGTWRKCGGCNCEDCDPWKFGQNCSEVCPCNTTTAFSCNKINGTCTCKNGWDGLDCSVDMDECHLSSAICHEHSDCQNTPGSFQCICNVGYKMEESSQTCQECDLWKFGQNCSEVCLCNTTTTISCNKTDGTCSCQPGWIGDDCSLDFDECYLSPTGCPEHSYCRNEPGTYQCPCNVGYMFIESNKTCQECDQGKFGQDCSDVCDCNTTTSYGCNKMNGTCSCQPGWSSNDCSVDIDECHLSSAVCPEHSDCLNHPWTYQCICNVGYKMVNNICEECGEWNFGEDCALECSCNTNNSVSCSDAEGTCLCKPDWAGSTCSQFIGSTKQAIVAVQVTLNYNATGVNFNNEISEPYRQLRTEVEHEMTVKLTIQMKIEVIVVVTKLSQGSLIVNSTISFPESLSEDPKMVVTRSILHLMNNGSLKINNTVVSINAISVDKNIFTQGESKCEQRMKYDSCDGQCQEDEVEAICKPIENNKTDKFALGMGLGLSIFAVLCIAIGLVTYYWTRKQNKAKIHERKTDEDEAFKNRNMELQVMATRFSPDRTNAYSPYSSSEQQDVDRQSSHYDRPGSSKYNAPSEIGESTTGSHTNDYERIPRIRKIIL